MTKPLSKPLSLLLIGAIWFIAMFGSATALFSAYLGRADWGDGGASQMSVPAAAALVVLAVLAPVIAWLLTRPLLRRP
jgi:hypothetical protein